MDVSWIVPTYRDELNIERALREVDAYLRSKAFPAGYEIIVIGSRAGDRSREIVAGLRDDIPAVRLLTVDGHAKGWNVRTGMLTASGAIRIFSDADNATAPTHFDRMLPLFQSGHHVVVSSRSPHDAPGARRDLDESVLRRVGGALGNAYVRLIAGLSLRDTQNGFKGFTAAAADDLFNRLTIGGFAFDVEVLVLARLRHYRVGVVPVAWRHDSRSSVTMSAYFEVLRDVTMIGRNRLSGRYGNGSGQ